MQIGKQKKIKNYLNTGNKLKEEGKLDQAIEQYRRVLKLNPNSVLAMKKLAKIYEEREEFVQALEFYQKIAELRPDDISVEIGLARVATEQAEFAKALEKVNQILQIKPNYSPALKLVVRIARVRNSVGQKARKQLLTLVREDSSLFLKEACGQISRNLETVLFFLHISPREIVQILADKQDKTDQDIALSQLCQGISCKKRGKFAKALKHFEESGLAQPTYIIPCLKALGKEKEVETIVREGMGQSPKFALIKELILSKLEIDYQDKLLLFIGKNNVGDVCGHLSNIKSICEYYQGKALVFYRGGGAAEILGKMFLEPLVSEYVAGHFPIDGSIWNRITKANPDKLELIPLNEVPIGKGRPRFLILGNPIEKPLEDSLRSRPAITTEDKASALAKFTELGLKPNATVLIAPHSNYYDRIRGTNVVLSKFWMSLFEILDSKRLSIAINARNHQSLLGYSWLKDSSVPLTFVDISLREVIPFVDRCGYYLSTMTGLCELLCFTDKNVKKACVHLINKEPGIIPSRVYDPNTRQIKFPLPHIQFPHIQFMTSEAFLHYGINLSPDSEPSIEEQISNLLDLYFEQNQLEPKANPESIA